MKEGYVLVMTSLWLLGGVSSQDCPWEEQGLLPWSDAMTWESFLIPSEGSEVLISTGKRVLLDIQPPRLATVTIQKGAALIWGNVSGLVLRVEYIMVEGEFIVGSEVCPFIHKAHIKLYGKSDSRYFIDDPNFGRKFIGVAEGGTLELHGKPKTSWTRLSQTIPELENIECGVVYNHSSQLIGKERQKGLHVIIWNEDGSALDFDVFDLRTFENVSKFVQTIPDGKIIGMFLFGSDGIGRRGDPAQNGKLAYLDMTIQKLGGDLITKVTDTDSYSFIVRKGDPSSASEFYLPDGQRFPGEERYLHLTDWSRHLDFQVAASSSISFNYFRVLNTEAAYPILTLADEVVGWEPGDKIVVASTDSDWRHAELRTLIPCVTCTSRQVRVNETFKYLHYGNITYNVDERAEVGMLTRSIVIEGVMEPECYYNDQKERKLCQRFNRDTFGGNIRILRGHASVHIEGVELYHMGQQALLSRYPIHFHMCDEVAGMYVRDNSVYDSFSRCVTVHGTHRLLVQRNVCYLHLGHGIFLEDSVEQDNVIEGNLVLGSQHGTLLMSDSRKEWCKEDYPQKDFTVNCDELATYWITHPNNVINNNAAAGGEGKGFKIVYADLPLGPSFDRQMELGRVHNPWNYPIKSFTGNTAHANTHAGLFIDSKISTGRLESENEVPENGILQVTNGYDPRSPPTPDGVQVWTELRRNTFYKNIRANVWIKGGNIRLAFCTLADSREAFSGGTSSMSSGTEVTHSIFIGETDNNGIQYDSRVLESLTGIGVYQGPNFIKNCYFDRFDTQTLTGSAGNTVTRHAGGISFKRSNAYPTMTSCYMQNITFGYCDGEHGGNWVFHGNASVYGWEERDGNLGVFLRDADGSVTGTPNSCLVRNFPFYKGPECSDRPTWGLTVCPYRYIKMEILGAGGSLSKPNKDKTPMIIRRDDSPYDKPFIIEGLIRNEYLLRTHKSYLIDFNNQLTGGGFPESISFSGYGVEKGDVVRVGICQPLDVDGYSVRSFYPAVIKDNATWASSLEELDADTTGRVFFHDKQNGILFFKLLSRHTRTNDTQLCPGGYCFQVKFDVIGGNLKKMRSCFGISVPPYADNTPKPQVPEPKPCPGHASPEGLGALDWSKVGFVSHEKYSVQCTSSSSGTVTSSTVLGCFVEKYAGLQNDTIVLGNSMTNRWCLKRCKGRGYAYAGLLRGDRCVCGNTLNRQPQSMADLQLCRKYPCSGDVTEFCGGIKEVYVIKTEQVLQFVGHVSGRKVLSGVCLADFQTACGKSVPPGTPQ